MKIRKEGWQGTANKKSPCDRFRQKSPGLIFLTDLFWPRSWVIGLNFHAQNYYPFILIVFADEYKKLKGSTLGIEMAKARSLF
ncbi:hypothetical protein LIT25_23630 [Bacillus sp. F19]|nr:hypothetical protein LIT25_23630 [Bacillus sp. F19]